MAVSNREKNGHDRARNKAKHFTQLELPVLVVGLHFG